MPESPGAAATELSNNGPNISWASLAFMGPTVIGPWVGALLSGANVEEYRASVTAGSRRKALFVVSSKGGDPGNFG